MDGQEDTGRKEERERGREGRDKGGKEEGGAERFRYRNSRPVEIPGVNGVERLARMRQTATFLAWMHINFWNRRRRGCATR